MRVYGPVFLAAVMLMSSAGALAQTGNAGEAGSLPEIANNAPVGSRENPMRVSSGVVAGLKLRGETPVYPAYSPEVKVAGGIVMSAMIDPEGKIVSLKVISGAEALREPTLAAVRKWTYKPFLLNGSPVFVRTQITMVPNFGSPQ